MGERKCFGCGGFGHMASNCRNMGKEEPMPVSSNRFEVLKVRVMQRGKGSSKKAVKDRKTGICEKCGWNIELYRTHCGYSGDGDIF